MEKKIAYDSPEFQLLGLEPEEDVVTSSIEDNEWTDFY